MAVRGYHPLSGAQAYSGQGRGGDRRQEPLQRVGRIPGEQPHPGHRAMKRNTGIDTCQSKTEIEIEEKLWTHLKNLCEKFGPTQTFMNLGLFLPPKHLSRILFLDFIYRQIIGVQGAIFDLGTRWGNSTAIFSSLRGIYEPFNRHRKLVGFDTFAGLTAESKEDCGKRSEGDCATVEGWEKFLVDILLNHASLDPLSHVNRTAIVKGDVAKTLPQYFRDYPETIVALAFFDMDFYAPTKSALLDLQPRLTKGSLLAFDELNDPMSPGETTALMEVLGLRNIRLQRFPYASRVSYLVVE